MLPEVIAPGKDAPPGAIVHVLCWLAHWMVRGVVLTIRHQQLCPHHLSQLNLFVKRIEAVSGEQLLGTSAQPAVTLSD